MILVVGAHSRNIGKTSLVCAIVRATPELDWTAIKISSNRSSAATRARLSREETVDDRVDTGRFLAAGARSAWWLRAKDEQLPAAVRSLSSIITSVPNVVIESNRIVDYLRPDYYLMALDVTVEDFKESARRLAPRADAFVFVDRGNEKPEWLPYLTPQLESRPQFRVVPPEYISQELVARIREHPGLNPPNTANMADPNSSALRMS